MKKALIFILGIVTGFILTIIAGNIIAHRQNSHMKMFDEPGKVMEQKAYKVIQAFNDGTALATDYSYGYSGSLTVLLKTSSSDMYYDEQIVRAPSNACFKQVGLYTYKSQLGQRTVPIVTCFYK